MTPTEAVKLCRIVAAACPQQALDEYTPDTWHDLLGDLEFADCRAAVGVIGMRQPFVAPSEIRTEVRRIRAERIARSVIPAPAPELCDNPRAYQRVLAGSLKQAADGQGEQVERLAIAQADSPHVQLKHPVALRQALARFRHRRALPPRPATIPDEHRALEQAAKARASRPAQAGDDTQEAS